MRYPAMHKEQVRQRIIREASRALRRHGLQGVGIPALMKRAGLTHGAFYSHFDSRDELVAAAIRAAAAETAGTALSPDKPLDHALAQYLSPEHLAHPDHGCVLAALGTDAARHGPAVRKAFAETARGFLELADRGNESSSLQPSNAAIVRAATMLGTVLLARMVDDPALAGRILRAARSSAGTE